MELRLDYTTLDKKDSQKIKKPLDHAISKGFDFERNLLGHAGFGFVDGCIYVLQSFCTMTMIVMLRFH